MKLSSIVAFAGVLIPCASSSSSSSSSARQEVVLNALGEPSYGVDVSFPVHHINLRSNADDDNENDNENDKINPLGDRQKVYNDFMTGCRSLYSMGCDHMEKDRVAMSLREPPAMHNYTDIGFKKVRTPSNVQKLLKDFYLEHRSQKVEENNMGNLFVNHWSSPTYMINIEEEQLLLRGGNNANNDNNGNSVADRNGNTNNNLKTKVWDSVKPLLESWSGVELTPAFIYGIREYSEGAILSPHVDRKPYVISCIINVAQDDDGDGDDDETAATEDWPLEVYGRDGLAINVTMEEGDMIMYESHSLIHGRPFALRGKYFANLLVNFTPTEKVLRQRHYTPVTINNNVPIIDRRRSSSSPEKDATADNNNEEKEEAPRTHLARAAATGDIASMIRYATVHENNDLLHEKDSNGWQPIHEAARGGQLDAVRLLVEHGADVNERTNFGKGASLLELVLEKHGGGHPLFGYLESLGAEL